MSVRASNRFVMGEGEMTDDDIHITNSARSQVW